MKTVNKKINNYINEPYCSFELSSLLKEKGFDCQCDMLHISGEKYPTTREGFESGYGMQFAQNSWIDDYEGEYGFKDYLKNKKIVTVPTHAVAKEWLTVNFDLEINIKRMWRWSENVATKKMLQETFIQGSISNFTLGRENDYVLYVSNIPYKTSHEATEETLLYALKNLI